MKSPDYTINRRQGGFPHRREDGLLALLLVVAVIVAYWPALHGGMLFDDDVHISKNLTLLSLHGLKQIWFVPGATYQYYPLTFTVFWIDYHLWGLNTLGYHLTNVLTHALTAILLWQLLKCLKVPGAFLAGAIFALHPVNVMSVAWMTELKNTLSGALAVGACWTYVRWAGLGVYATPGTSDSSKRPQCRRFYVLSLTLFLLAMLAKTSVSLLPVTLLLLVWWQKDRLRWDDVLSIGPLVFIVAAIGKLTLAIEDPTHMMDKNFHLSFLERVLVSGRSFWFYLGKLMFPYPLTFIYERWEIDPAAGWQYLFPAATLAVLIMLWLARRRVGKAPLVAALHFYLGTSLLILIVVLTMMQYTFVSDHWQYLGSMSVVALVAAGLATVLKRWGLWGRVPGIAVIGVLLLTLGGLTWRQSHIYCDAQTLYLSTLARNPNCCVAHNNLGVILDKAGHPEEAIEHFQEALRLQPSYPQTHYILGLTLVKVGRLQEAIEQFQEALRLQLNYPEVHDDLGLALAQIGRLPEAIAHFEQALQLKPEYPEAHNNLGLALLRKGRVNEAIVHLQKALEIRPDFAEAHSNLGLALLRKGQVDEAFVHLQKALEIQPDYAEAHFNLGVFFLRMGQTDKAIAYFQEGLELQPNNPQAHNGLGVAFLRKGQVRETIVHFQKALEIQPGNADAHKYLAWILATYPEASVRNGVKAVELAQQANQLTGGKDPAIITVLAAAYAEAGRFPEAATTAQKALQLVESQTNAASVVNALQTQIKCYQAGSPFRDSSLTNTPATTP